MHRCRFPTCACLVPTENEPCAIHRYYRLASDLESCVGTECAACHHTIKKTDWCVAEYTFQKNKKKEYHKTYHHAACEPAKPSKRQMRREPKPLLDGIEAVG